MLDRLLRSIFPGACLLCDVPLPDGQDLDLCDDCLRELPRVPQPCPRCGLPTPAQGTDGAWHAPMPSCSACASRPPPYVRTIAPLHFADPVDHWIRRLKDHSGMVEGRTLGLLLAAAALQAYRDQAPPDLLIPVPLTLARLARRGHNQALVLARPVARALGIPLLPAGARRIRTTPPQRGLGLAQRSVNLAGAFAIPRRYAGGSVSTIRRCRADLFASARRSAVAGRRVGIVDDVMTTGATVAELARTLLAAGASEVHVLCAARAVRIRADAGAALPCVTVTPPDPARSW